MVAWLWKEVKEAIRMAAIMQKANTPAGVPATSGWVEKGVSRHGS